MRKFFKILLFTFIIALVIAIAYVIITFPPVMAGMAAKTMCSCVFLTGRDPQSVKDKELRVFPGLSRAAISIHKDSTVTATVLWKESKAIFRKGLGCTLLAEKSEDEVRSQQIRRATPPIVNQDTIAWPGGDRIQDSSASVKYDV